MSDATNRAAHRVMRRLAKCAAVALIIEGSASALSSCATRPAAYTPSPERGEALALRICNDCHQISPARPSRSEDAGLSFMAMANAPDQNHAGLMLLITQWHTLDRFGLPDVPMPTFMLTREEREDIVSYILGFRTAPEAASAN